MRILDGFCRTGVRRQTLEAHQCLGAREYERLFKRCLASYWSEWADWPHKLRDQTLASLVTFISGLTTISIVSRSEWPAQRQIEQLSLQLSFLRRHALEVSGASRKLQRRAQGRQ